MYSAIENNPIFIDLTQAALSTGWTTDGVVASHDSCQPGSLFLLNYSLTIGQTYRYSYDILSISSGYVQVNIGTSQTTPGFVTETVVATSAQISIFANGTCSIENFVIEVDTDVVSEYAQNTIAFSEKIGKWTSFYTYAPDSAFSLFVRSYTFKDGDAYFQEANTPFRCNFFGAQYLSTIYFSSNEQPSFPKTYQSINYQANQLLITPPSGVVSANGQVSELIPTDFLQMELADAVSPSVFIYDVEGIFKANFMRAFPDLVNGDVIQGNYLTMGLQTTAPSGILVLFTTELNYVRSYSNTR